MEELIKKVEKILDAYLKDNLGNRENPWSFRTLKQVILGEIANHKVDKKIKEEETLRPITNKTIKEAKK